MPFGKRKEKKVRSRRLMGGFRGHKHKHSYDAQDGHRITSAGSTSTGTTAEDLNLNRVMSGGSGASGSSGGNITNIRVANTKKYPDVRSEDPLDEFLPHLAPENTVGIMARNLCFPPYIVRECLRYLVCPHKVKGKRKDGGGDGPVSPRPAEPSSPLNYLNDLTAVQEDSACVTEGIFRLSASATEVETLLNQFRAGRLVRLDRAKLDPHIVAGVLKRWLREDCIDPLFTRELYDAILAAAAIPDEEAKRRCLLTVMGMLPRGHFVTAQLIFRFLYKLASEFSDATKMGFPNLAIVFAPGLLKPFLENVTNSMLLNDSTATADAVADIIQLTPELFRDREDLQIDVAPAINDDTIAGMHPADAAKIQVETTRLSSTRTRKHRPVSVMAAAAIGGGGGSGAGAPGGRPGPKSGGRQRAKSRAEQDFEGTLRQGTLRMAKGFLEAESKVVAVKSQKRKSKLKGESGAGMGDAPIDVFGAGGGGGGGGGGAESAGAPRQRSLSQGSKRERRKSVVEFFEGPNGAAVDPSFAAAVQPPPTDPAALVGDVSTSGSGSGSDSGDDGDRDEGDKDGDVEVTGRARITKRKIEEPKRRFGSDSNIEWLQAAAQQVALDAADDPASTNDSVVLSFDEDDDFFELDDLVELLVGGKHHVVEEYLDTLSVESRAQTVRAIEAKIAAQDLLEEQARQDSPESGEEDL